MTHVGGGSKLGQKKCHIIFEWSLRPKKLKVEKSKQKLKGFDFVLNNNYYK